MEHLRWLPVKQQLKIPTIRNINDMIPIDSVGGREGVLGRIDPLLK